MADTMTDENLHGDLGVDLGFVCDVHNGTGDSIRHLIGMAAGDTLRSKQSFFHYYFVLSYTQEYPKNKMHTSTDPMCVSIESSSFVCRRIWHHTENPQVAGFHRAVPSTALDKACMQFEHILQLFFHLSTLRHYFFIWDCS